MCRFWRISNLKFEISNGEQSIPERRLGVWIIGLVLIVLLWLPPLPYRFNVVDLPVILKDTLVSFHLVKANATWPLRLDYFLIPPLFIYALWLTWKSGLKFQEAGFGMKYFGGASRYLWIPTTIGALILVCLGNLDHCIEWNGRFLKRLIPLNAFVQQIGIQLFFYRQLVPWFGSGRKTAIVLTVFFALLHAPNPGLMIGTFFGMYFWVRSYQKQPNLYALALSHAFLSAILMQTMPKWLLPSVSVGHRFVEKGIANQWWGWFS